MKILTIHAKYQQKGGEDAECFQEVNILNKTEEVHTLIFQNQPGWRGALQFLFSPWNISAGSKIKKAIREHNPDIVQLFNWHYAIGPVAVRVAKKAGKITAVNLQNYRLLCPSGTLLHNGKLFTESLSNGFPWKAVRKKVYRGSSFQTFWLAFVVWFHKKRGTWRMVDQFITPTNTVKNLYLKRSAYLGISPDRFVVKPNFTDRPDILPSIRKNNFLFVGRLSEEKGILVLLDAFRNSPNELHIAGDGPFKQDVVRASMEHPNIKYLGNLDKEGVKKAMLTCTAFIFTSIWYEPFGLVITEAMSTGCPLIASDIGSPTELVQDGVNGFHFKAGDASALREQANRWQLLNEVEKDQFRRNCVATYKELYTPEKNAEQLIRIYKGLLK